MVPQLLAVIQQEKKNDNGYLKCSQSGHFKRQCPQRRQNAPQIMEIKILGLCP